MGVVRATFSIRDEKGAIGKCSFWFNQDFICEIDGSLGGYLLELAEAIDAIIRGVIIKINVTWDVDLPPSIKQVVDGKADVEETWTTVFYTNGRIGRFKNVVPTANHELDPSTDEAIGNYHLIVALPEELPADWSYGATDNRGEDIVGWDATQKTFGKDRGETE